ncbi:rhodanese-like domain-containing protein [Haloarcula sp. S1CR25-12]|uniref:Rhodanese-like domain-containing protein n=1 Tax=Haloarcula saliterrae TaxID=2950534 RepID=A0ABU2FIQ9_9EURY|nr:rhodanese-like domain-containing protein [Haloarcula sp. S1CR25-12]MDS0261661.1 rhodanese-like domain-containing protein [Haloarcula sp. S1CR25-12]
MTDIVSAEWVADNVDRLRIVDVRDGWEYDAMAHLPGAVSVPFDSFRTGSSDSEGMLPSREEWGDLLSAAGVSADSELVAYDDHHGVFAARFLVTAELLGHDPAALHLLDGDFSSWQLEHPTSGETPAVEPTDYSVDPPETTPLVDSDTVAAAADDPDAVLVDTRDESEYAEGHIPGARLLDWRELVDDETRGLLAREDALAVLEAAGIVPEKRVVLYCNTARRISHTYVVLRHLGFETVEFYEGSLTEWEAQDRPLETER